MTRENQKAPIINLKLTSMAQGGVALGRDETGRVVFVPYAIAGEEVRVEIVEAKKEFARARPIEIVTPSPSRVTPRCPHFGPLLASPVITGDGSGVTSEYVDTSRWAVSIGTYQLDYDGADSLVGLRVRGCGGCQWQHIDYAAQLEFKTQIVREQFARIGKMPHAPIDPMIPDPRAWNYRNHMRFTLNQNGELCLKALESHDLIPIRECHIIDPPLTSLFNTLELEGADFDAVTLRAGENTGDRLIILESRTAEPPEMQTDETVSIHFQFGDVVVPLIGKAAIEEKVRGRVFQISPRSFFQVNTPMAEQLLNLVEEFLSPHANDILLDAYGGVGLFGLSLASRVARVIEIEENVHSVADAQYNARDLNNVEFYAGRVEDMLPRLDYFTNLAIVDPPRAGLAREALAALASKQPPAIAYVSCDPATLARDARLLVDAGYRLERVQPVDLFPQTYHIECVAQFVRPTA